MFYCHTYRSELIYAWTNLGLSDVWLRTGLGLGTGPGVGVGLGLGRGMELVGTNSDGRAVNDDCDNGDDGDESHSCKTDVKVCGDDDNDGASDVPPPPPPSVLPQMDPPLASPPLPVPASASVPVPVPASAQAPALASASGNESLVSTSHPKLHSKGKGNDVDEDEEKDEDDDDDEDEVYFSHYLTSNNDHHPTSHNHLHQQQSKHSIHPCHSNANSSHGLRPQSHLSSSHHIPPTTTTTTMSWNVWFSKFSLLSRFFLPWFMVLFGFLSLVIGVTTIAIHTHL